MGASRSHAGGGRLRDLGSFEIERAENTDAFRRWPRLRSPTRIAFSSSASLPIWIAAAEVGHQYRYQMISSTLDGYRSDPSNEAEITYQLPKPPPNPENFVHPAAQTRCRDIRPTL